MCAKFNFSLGQLQGYSPYVHDLEMYFLYLGAGNIVQQSGCAPPPFTSLPSRPSPWQYFFLPWLGNIAYRV